MSGSLGDLFQRSAFRHGADRNLPLGGAITLVALDDILTVDPAATSGGWRLPSDDEEEGYHNEARCWRYNAFVEICADLIHVGDTPQSSYLIGQIDDDWLPLYQDGQGLLQNDGDGKQYQVYGTVNEEGALYVQPSNVGQTPFVDFQASGGVSYLTIRFKYLLASAF